VPDAPLVRFLKPFQLPVKEIQAFNVAYDGGIARCMRSFQICCQKRAAQSLVRDHFIYPIEAA
jgi:hypothetical protein